MFSEMLVFDYTSPNQLSYDKARLLAFLTNPAAHLWKGMSPRCSPCLLTLSFADHTINQVVSQPAPCSPGRLRHKEHQFRGVLRQWYGPSTINDALVDGGHIEIVPISSSLLRCKLQRPPTSAPDIHTVIVFTIASRSIMASTQSVLELESRQISTLML